MSHDLPLDWYEEHDGQRLVLSTEKVAAEIDRLRFAIETVAKTFEKDLEQGFRTRDKEFAITILRNAVPLTDGQSVKVRE